MVARVDRRFREDGFYTVQVQLLLSHFLNLGWAGPLRALCGPHHVWVTAVQSRVCAALALELLGSFLVRAQVGWVRGSWLQLERTDP